MKTILSIVMVIFSWTCFAASLDQQSLLTVTFAEKINSSDRTFNLLLEQYVGHDHLARAEQGFAKIIASACQKDTPSCKATKNQIQETREKWKTYITKAGQGDLITRAMLGASYYLGELKDKEQRPLEEEYNLRCQTPAQRCLDILKLIDAHRTFRAAIMSAWQERLELGSIKSLELESMAKDQLVILNNPTNGKE